MSKEIEKIVEEFKEEFPAMDSYFDASIHEGVARYFHDILTQQKEELKKMIEGKRIVVEEKEKGTYYAQHCNGYNQALDDIISELNHE